MKDSWRFWAKLALIVSIGLGCFCSQRSLDRLLDQPTVDEDLIAAAASCDDVSLESSLNDGANVLARDLMGCTALAYAAQRGDVRIARRLLNEGANVNAADVHGMSPLMWAIIARNLAVVQLLCQRGADIHAGNDSNMTALQQAEQLRCDDIVEFLRSIERSQTGRSLACGD